MHQRYDDNVVVEDAKCTGETDKGIWVSAPDFDEDEFIPEQFVHDDSEVSKPGERGDLIVTRYFAENIKGWI